MGPRTALSWLLWLPLVAGCGGGEDLPPPGDPLPSCESPAVAIGDGSCLRPGIALDGCAEGFVHDGMYGCEPLLPAEPCAAGRMAVPGESACRPVMECGAGRFGDIPLEATAQHVDASYAGGDSDGSESRPWPTVMQAVGAAAPGALVAIAEGSYHESVSIIGKPVRLWGVCPDRAEIVGSSTGVATVFIRTQASGTELHGLSLRGDGVGVLLSGSQDVVIDQVWVHQTATAGIVVQDDLGPTSATVTGSLVEQSHVEGVFVAGATITVEGTVVRGILPRVMDNAFGHGFTVQVSCPQGACDISRRSVATVRRSVVEDNLGVGMFIASSDLELDGSVVRDTQPFANDQKGGVGIAVQVMCLGAECFPTARSNAIVRGSLIERNHEVGLLVAASNATVERTVVRDSLPRALDETFGRGISVQHLCTMVACDPSARSIATVRDSVLANHHDVGLVVRASDATMEGTVVRGTVPQASDGLYGDGVSVFGAAGPASITIRRSLIEDSARAGLSIFASVASLSATAVRCAAFALAGESVGDLAFELEDGGANLCGCPSAGDLCSVISAGIEPPQPPEPL